MPVFGDGAHEKDGYYEDNSADGEDPSSVVPFGEQEIYYIYFFFTS